MIGAGKVQEAEHGAVRAGECRRPPAAANGLKRSAAVQGVHLAGCALAHDAC